MFIFTMFIIIYVMFKITKLIEFFVTKFDTISTLRYGVSWVPSYSTWHRISTARREKGRGGLFFLQIEPN